MSETKVIDTEPQIVEPSTEEIEQISEIEQQAIEHGWNPDGVEGKRNLSAEEFMDRQVLYDDIRSLKKSNRKLQEGIEAMNKMQEGIRQREREKTIRELQAQKKFALENENYDAVVEIDDAIAVERAEATAAPKSNIEFENWVDNNEWYSQDPELKSWADTFGTGYASNHPDKPASEVYEVVTKEVKKRFPEKFGDKVSNQPPAVEGAQRGRSARSGKRYSAADLPEEDRAIMKTILRTGTMTQEEYLKQYFG